MAASYLSKLNPVPGFAAFTGPYKVGTVDVEIPVDDLDSPSPAPEGCDIETVQFRIFYPTAPESTGKNITWLPAPQRPNLAAYVKFLGAGPLLADAISLLPRHLHYTTIPAIKNAPLLEPNTPNQRWPTAFFSHGLGGNRNAYSQITGQLASHGVVVICPEHRDGSAAATFVRLPTEQHRYFMRDRRREIPYKRIPHDPTEEVREARSAQLRIRLWELGLIHDAVLRIDQGTAMTNLNTSTPSLDQFVRGLDIHEPGSIIFGGHSFGATTTVQFLKSVYYAGSPAVSEMKEPLFSPPRDSAICAQITPKTITILLDMWCFPLTAKATSPLFNLPLPVFADQSSATGGNGLLAIESEAFTKWKEHFHVMARVISPDPTAPVVEARAFQRPSGIKLQEPNFFYVHNSAHLNQSDFGVLFPWLTKKVFGSAEPERVLRLNMRAILQLLRVNNVPIGRTSSVDLVDGAPETKMAEGDGPDDGIHDDKAIFDRSGNSGVEAWSWIDIIGMGDEAAGSGNTEDQKVAAEAQEPAIGAEMEPQVSEGEAVKTVVATSA
ncbi:hypothetical protein E8E14_014994 [Neopestalotiopsis sp. 37M]|nr:hypothetical protein E8E14_014994 [Neopestalotiopsis sp. 37M]